jgi:hypothetical protein
LLTPSASQSHSPVKFDTCVATNTRPHTMTETLDSWLGRRPVVMDARALSPVRIARRSDRIVFGVLGTRNKMSYEDFVEQILDPVIEAWGLPEEFLIPGDGESGEVIQAWAARNDIPVNRVAADWVRNGKRAGLLRDARIQREASHLILLQGPRSNAMTTLAGKLQRKGKPVALSERPGEAVRALE